MKGAEAVQSTFLVELEKLLDAALQVPEIQGIILNPWNRTIDVYKRQAVGFAGGVLAMNGTNFAGLANGETTGISGGFLAALLAGFVAGYVVEFLKKMCIRDRQLLSVAMERDCTSWAGARTKVRSALRWEGAASSSSVP